ncbi:uncharacterized protein LOC135500319 [Lineus longissimus]|uniref:uncharacterized protein LOC135500319 n=1 Tax=Lineus longissimus TaxID=88925 RepID=UPI002B4ECE54
MPYIVLINMGRPKAKKKAKRTDKDSLKELAGGSSRSKAVSQAAIATEAKYSVSQLLDKAEELIDAFDYEVAQKFCQRALELEVDNTRALETSGTLMLETGNAEAAKQCFGRAIELSPEKGYSKYMALGQLFEGQQSIQCYQKGIELMVKEMQEHQEKQVAAACAQDDKHNELCRGISSAYCSVAEIYMTDCCDDEGAEEKCQSSIEKSIEADNSNPEAYQMMASFLLVKQDKDNAKEAINRSVSLWLPKFKEREKSTSEDFDPVEAVPLTYQTRVQAAQILTEVEEYQTAFEILESLLDEDDEVIQVWYMIGLLNHLQGSEYYGNARHYLAKAKELSTKLVCDDEPMLKHIEELIDELGAGDEEAVETDGDDWEDVDSSTEEEAMDAL